MFRYVTLSVLFSVILSANAFADPDVDDRLSRLERDITTLQRSIYRSTTPTGQSVVTVAPNNSAELEVRLTQLEENLRTINGRIEKLEFSTRTLEEKMATIQTMFNQPRPADTSITPPPSDIPPATSDIPPSQNLSSDQQIMQQYDRAFSLLRQAHYDEAEAAFQQFIKDHGNNDLTGNAYYWLGESYYARKNFENAAVYFLEGFQKFPKGSKAPDSLLKLAFTLSNLNKVKEACATFTKLAKEFPDVSQSIRQRADGEYNRLQCR